MLFNSVEEIYSSTGSISKIDGSLRVNDAAALRREGIDRLIYNAVFNENNAIRAETRWVIKSTAASLGVKLASIQGLYEAMGRGEATRPNAAGGGKGVHRACD